MRLWSFWCALRSSDQLASQIVLKTHDQVTLRNSSRSIYQSSRDLFSFSHNICCFRLWFQSPLAFSAWNMKIASPGHAKERGLDLAHNPAEFLRDLPSFTWKLRSFMPFLLFRAY
jgi:hypothetical protein